MHAFLYIKIINHYTIYEDALEFLKRTYESDFVPTGRIAEYDTPAKLLEREESLFSKLIKEYSMRSQSFNNLANLHN